MTLQEAIKEMEETTKVLGFYTQSELDAISVVLKTARKYKTRHSCEGCQSIGKKYLIDQEYNCDICRRERGTVHESDYYCKKKEME